MKAYHVFESDKKFIVLEVLQHKDKFFSKRVDEFLTLDLAVDCATMLNEMMTSAGTLGAGKAKSDPTAEPKGPVDGYDPLLRAKQLLRRKKPRV